MSRLVAMLREKYPAAEYAFFSELRNGTGWSRVTRSADAVAFSLWPSRGLELLGFECKVSRSDWKRELAAPAKAEAIQQYCDRWWVVVSDPKIVAEGELPPTWGLLAATKGLDEGSKLKVITAAPKLEPKPIDRPILASMLRNFADAREADFANRLEPMLQERLKHDRPYIEAENERLRKQLAELGQSITKFENASGLNVRNGWDLPHLGELKQLLFGPGWHRGSLEALRKAAGEAAKTYTQAAEDAARAATVIDQLFADLDKKKPEAA